MSTFCQWQTKIDCKNEGTTQDMFKAPLAAIHVGAADQWESFLQTGPCQKLKKPMEELISTSIKLFYFWEVGLTLSYL